MITFENNKSRHFAKKMVQVQENERTNLARELHDEFGQLLTAIHIDASAILATKKLKSAYESAAEIDMAALQMMDIIHVMLKRLKPNSYGDLGLEPGLNELIVAWHNRANEIKINFQLDGDFSDLNESTSTVIYRLVQESLTNISRHSEAQNVSINLHRNEDHILLMVNDDGKGFDTTKKQQRFGLLGMRGRVDELNGSFELLSGEGIGVSIVVTLPLSKVTKALLN